MQHIPEIAIVEQNTDSIGLADHSGRAYPRSDHPYVSVVRQTDRRYAGYVQPLFCFGTDILRAYVVLSGTPSEDYRAGGRRTASLSGIPTLNVCLPQDKLVKAIMQMRKQGHEVTHHPVSPQEMQQEHDLSPREIEVLTLITKGLINKEIADKLNISLTTVISHRKNITEKLGIKSVSGLAIYAVMHGYVEADRI